MKTQKYKAAGKEAGIKKLKILMNNVRPLTNVTVIFTKPGNGKTKVTLIHTGWRQGENWELARQYFVKAWNRAFKKLEELVNH